EFTVLEAYEALGDYKSGMNLTESLLVSAAKESTGRLAFKNGDLSVDLTPPWPRRALLELLSERLGKQVHPSMPTEEARSLCKEHDVEFQDDWSSGRLLFELYDKVLMPGLEGPIFVYGYPVEVSPLARANKEDPTITDRFELVIVGREFTNGYSELNDPEEQLKRFRLQAVAAAAGDLEAPPPDIAYVRALEYGLPPTSGIGIGVDRLVMLLAEVGSIRDVILFPTLRPEQGLGLSEDGVLTED
ncbi:MAG TPA: amino acid--tRNA ligase-related protein, partial [Acidimicrobiales bacterium]|nr:amino acid--tRNA ligase-related protein [Acidimicrobiales bacterium]